MSSYGKFHYQAIELVTLLPPAYPFLQGMSHNLMWILAAYAYSLVSHIVVLLVLYTWLHYFGFTECGQGA